MYRIRTTDRKVEMLIAPPFGPGFAPAEAEAAVTMEVWGSGFNDPGADFCEFRLFDSTGQQIAVKRREAY